MSTLIWLATNVAYLLLILLLLIVLLLAYTALCTYSMHRHWHSQHLPSAPFIPIVGHILATNKYVTEDRITDVFHERTAKYGDLYSITFGPTARLSVNSPPHLADVLRNCSDCYEKGFVNRLFVGNIVGLENLLLTEGVEHSKTSSYD